MKWVLILGNIQEGYVFIGPFDSADEAYEWSDENPRDRNDQVDVAMLYDPKATVDWKNE